MTIFKGKIVVYYAGFDLVLVDHSQALLMADQTKNAALPANSSADSASRPSLLNAFDVRLVNCTTNGVVHPNTRLQARP